LVLEGIAYNKAGETLMNMALAMARYTEHGIVEL
jgi:hypothetical protein